MRALTSFARTFCILEVLQIAASSNASHPNEIHCLWMQSSGLMQFFSATRFLNPVTFRSHFYLISTAVFCKYLLHFMFLVNFTIAFVLCHLVKFSLGLRYIQGVWGDYWVLFCCCDCDCAIPSFANLSLFFLCQVLRSFTKVSWFIFFPCLLQVIVQVIIYFYQLVSRCIHYVKSFHSHSSIVFRCALFLVFFHF